MKLLIVGAGGYGAGYVAKALEDPNAVIAGVVEPFFDTCSTRDKILEAGIPVYQTMEAFYAEHDAQLALISTPTYLHASQSLCALEHGTHVLCEKPAAPSVAQVEAMMDGAKKWDRFVAIGYQWSFAHAMRRLKQDILDGKMGKALTLKTVVNWPRDHKYYARGGGWGGRIQKDGVLINDSIASNACAHYLHNMLYVLGSDMGTSVLPVEMEAECLRVNAIENFDTCVLRMKTEQGALLFFAASHGADGLRNPEFEYRFEQAVVRYPAGNGKEVVAEFADGTVVNYGNPFENDMTKYEECVECAEHGGQPICTPKTAICHTKVIEAIQTHVSITDFPGKLIREDVSAGRVYGEGIREALDEAYDTMSLFSQIRPEFATKPASFSLR